MEKASKQDSTYAEQIVKAILENGIISARALRLIAAPVHSRNIEKAEALMRSRDITEDKGYGKARVYFLQLKRRATREYVEDMIGEGNTEKIESCIKRRNKLKSQERERRAAALSEIFVMMGRVGALPKEQNVMYIPWDMAKRGEDTYNKGCPLYMRTTAMRETKTENNALGYTRLCGALYGDAIMYAVYNYGSNGFTWREKGEYNAAVYVWQYGLRFYNESMQNYTRKVDSTKAENAILYVHDIMQALESFAAPEKKRRRNGRRRWEKEKEDTKPITVYDRNNSYLHLHYIPLDYDGILATRFLLMKDWERALHSLHPHTEDGGEYDGYHVKDNDDYYFFFFCCDMCKLHDFLIMEKEDGDKIIYCYTWQKELVRAAMEMLGIAKNEIKVEGYSPNTVMNVFAAQLAAEDEYRRTHTFLAPEN